MTGEVRALVTGGAGFLGRHVVRRLIEQGATVHATHTPQRTVAASIGESTVGARWHPLDVTSHADTDRVISEVSPTIVYHLAGQSRVQRARADPLATFRVNAEGTLNLLESVRRLKPDTRFIFAGSGTEYGTPDLVPTPEEAPLRPTSPYAVSKAAAELVCEQYFRGGGLPVVRLRLFAATGVGKRDDFCNEMAEQIARLEGTKDPVIRVGDLANERDILDGKDAAEAILVAGERGRAGEVYNVGRGVTIQLRHLLDLLLKESTTRFEVVPEPERFRPADAPRQQAGVTRIRALGWKPIVPIEETVHDLISFWRGQVARDGGS